MSVRPYGRAVKEEIIKLCLEKKRTIISLSEEYGISQSTISRWLTIQRNMQSKDNYKGRGRK